MLQDGVRHIVSFGIGGKIRYCHLMSGPGPKRPALSRPFKPLLLQFLRAIVAAEFPEYGARFSKDKWKSNVETDGPGGEDVKENAWT